MNFCANTVSIGSERPSRHRCKNCELYFDEQDGITILNLCLSCIQPCFAPDPSERSLFSSVPRPPWVDPQEISIERELTRTRLALYFLYEALKRTQFSLTPGKTSQQAFEVFLKNFPEFIDLSP